VEDDGRTVMRRSALLIVNYAITLVIFIRGISKINVTAFEFIDVVNLIGALVFVILIIKSLIEPYIVIVNKTIRISRDHFKKETFKIEDVIDLEISDSPFSRSFFLLNEGEKVKFNSFAIGKEDRQLLIHRFSRKEKDGN
jgi:hypothetical protein